MRYLVAFLLLFTVSVTVSAADSLLMAVPARIQPSGFVEVAYVSELWTLSGKLPGAYSATSYTGKGFYAALGASLVRGKAHNYGCALSLGILQYNMAKSLHEIEQLPASYSFFRFAPQVWLQLNPGAPIQFTVAAQCNVLSPLQNQNHTYLQAGVRLGAQYEAWGVHLGYFFAPGQKGPVSGSLREQMITIGGTVYPARLKVWPQVLAKLHPVKQAKPTLGH
ncbi:MAG: hypothetical protein EBZ77_14815 [Chitinophagia bacterium]|nr:hypothetical protein [Chitinophagia bacterium]